MPELFYEGVHRRILWVEDTSGKTRAKAYFEALAPKERARIHALLKRMGDFGLIRDPAKFRPEGEGLYAFKGGRVRLLCFLDGRDVLLTNGYDNPSERIRRQEVTRAKRVRASYRAEQKGTSGRG